MLGDLHALLKKLANRRPLFHSEADFQHAFAWLIHEKFPDARIRLEYPVKLESGNTIRLDLWVEINGTRYAIELKYNTRWFQSEVSGELYHLRNQSAQDLGRYGFIKDVQRLEQIAKSENATGYAIMLTNDRGYWSASANTATIDAAFRLHENRQVTGEMRWAAHASPGTIKGIDKPITLEGSYIIQWHEYSKVSDGSAGQFRYIALEIK